MSESQRKARKKAAGLSNAARVFTSEGRLVLTSEGRPVFTRHSRGSLPPAAPGKRCPNEDGE